MSINPSADLIWGVPVTAYNEDTGEPRMVTYMAESLETVTRPLYDPEEGWNDELLRGTRLEWVEVGHYQDPEPKAILTIKSAERYSAGAWTFKEINPADLQGGMRAFDAPVPDKQVIKAGDEAVSLGLPDLRDGRWWLMAGLG